MAFLFADSDEKYRCEIKEILEMEMKILEALNYYLIVFHPYHALSQYVFLFQVTSVSFSVVCVTTHNSWLQEGRDGNGSNGFWLIFLKVYLYIPDVFMMAT